MNRQKLSSRPRARIALPAVATLLGLLAAPLLRAAEPTPLERVLERAARHAAVFVAQFSDVKCTEHVLQTKLGKNGRVEKKEESAYDYLLMLQAGGGELLLKESRLALAADGHNPNVSLMITNGFSTLLLVFHPIYQSSFEFTRLEDDVLDGKRFARVLFRHVRGSRSPTVLLLRGREYPLDLEGTAWIDEDSGSVAKLAVGLQSNLEDIGLRSIAGEVRYLPLTFSGTDQPYWLPSVATVDVETPRQHWRNVHRFSDYKLFSVSATSSIQGQP